MAKLGQTLYYSRNVEINLPGALFVPNSLLNQLRRETAEMLDDARLKAVVRGSRKPVSVPPPVYPETHLSFLANVYNHKAREFYQRYGVQLIDAAYEAHEEKGDVPVMITKHCLRFAFNLCPKQAETQGRLITKSLLVVMHFWFPRILPVVLLAQVGGGVFRLAAQLVAIGFVL